MEKRINSSKKGAKAERALSKELTAWVGVEFQRVPRSGGLRWGSGLMVTGDTIPADPVWLVRFPFSIESKVRASINFQELILDQNSEIASFWDQASTDAGRVDKIPIVFFRYDFLKKGLYFIVVSFEVFKAIKPVIKKTQKIKSMKYFNFSNKFVIFTSNYLLDSPYLEIEKSLQPWIK
jgi:hypothetical protein